MPTHSKVHTALVRAAACGALLALSACGADVSRSFGLTRSTPDEFTVTTLPPLSMPPDLTLHAPQPGQSRPAAVQSGAATLAPATVLAAPASAPAVASAGQDALLQAAGAAAPADIRARVAAEANGGQDVSLTDRLTSWAKPAQGASLVDPQKEADRLRTNAALGRTPDAGDTPVIRPKAPGLLDWFN